MIDQTAEALTYCGNRAVEQGNDALARWLYEEGLGATGKIHRKTLCEWEAAAAR